MNVPVDQSKNVIRIALRDAMDYTTFRLFVTNLLAEGKVTGVRQSESLLHYTRMNEYRMNRWDKVAYLDEELIQVVKSITAEQYWLVITEGWCGDSSQVLPFIALLARQNPKINVRIVLRDEHPELMDLYLTDGLRSIPMWIGLDHDLNELFRWGSRPRIAQELFRNLHSSTDPVYPNSEIKEKLHLWYARDKGQALLKEFGLLLSRIS